MRDWGRSLLPDKHVRRAVSVRHGADVIEGTMNGSFKSAVIEKSENPKEGVKRSMRGAFMPSRGAGAAVRHGPALRF